MRSSTRDFRARNGRRPLVAACILGLTAMSAALPAASDTGTAEEAAIRTIQDLRSRIQEPPAVRADTWLGFNPGRARIHCNPGWLETAAQFTEECRKGLGPAFDSVGRLVLRAMFPILMENPLLKRNQIEVAGETIGDVAKVAGVPVESVSCLAKGLVRARMGKGPDTEKAISKINAATDLYQLYGLLEGGATGIDKWLKGQSPGPVIGQIEPGKSVFAPVGDLAGAADTALGPTQVGGWFERIGKAYDGLSFAQWDHLEGSAEKARSLFQACDVDGALAVQQQVPAAARTWAGGWRAWIEKLEMEAFCTHASSSPFGGDLRKMESVANLKSTVQDYIDDLQQLRSSGFLDPAWAEPDSIEKKRQEAQEADARLKRLYEQEASLPGESCEIDKVLDDLRWLQTHTACVQFVSGGIEYGRVSRLQERLQRFDLAVESLHQLLSPAVDEARQRIEDCDLQEWSEPLSEAEREFERRNGRFWSLRAVKPCWRDGEWPRDEMAELAEERESELARATDRARTLLAEARVLMDDCSWNDAWEQLRSARDEVHGTQCTLDPSSCSGEGYDPVRCGLVIVRDQADELADKLTAREESLAPKLEAYEQAVRDLLQSIEEELYKAEQPENERRCEAAERVLELVGLSTSVVPPPECPNSTSEGFGERIEAAGEQATVALELGHTELERFRLEGDEAAESCDVSGIEGALAGIGELPVLCGVDVGAAAEALREKLRTARKDTDFVRSRIGDYEKEWGTARQHCDLDELGKVANAIAAFKHNPCAKNLTDVERGRFEALAKNTPAVVRDLATRKREVETALTAKYRVGEGYVRVLQDAEGGGEAALEGAQRIVRDAQAYLDFARNYTAPDALPELCCNDDLEQVRSLVSTIEGLIGKLGGLATVPPLRGRSDKFALTSLAESKLTPFILSESTLDETKVGKVADQEPAAGEKLPRWGTVSVWIYRSAVKPPPPTKAPVNCPSGTAWSPYKQRCLSIIPEGGFGSAEAAGRDCSHKWGSFFDERTGGCECFEGWVDTGPRCIDPGVAERQTQIDNTQAVADCAGSLAQVRIAAPWLVDAAVAQARASGCDPAQIEQAIADGNRRRRATPPPGGPGGEPAPTLTDREKELIRAGTEGAGWKRPTGSGGGSTPSDTAGGTGVRCSVVHLFFDYTQGYPESPARYLVFRMDPTDPRDPVKRGYGSLKVPARIEQRGKVFCTSARSCLRHLKTIPYEVLGDHDNEKSAREQLKLLCPDPVR